MSSLESKLVYAKFMSGYPVISRSDKYLAGLILFLRQNRPYEISESKWEVVNG